MADASSRFPCSSACLALHDRRWYFHAVPLALICIFGVKFNAEKYEPFFSVYFPMPLFIYSFVGVFGYFIYLVFLRPPVPKKTVPLSSPPQKKKKGPGRISRFIDNHVRPLARHRHLLMCYVFSATCLFLLWILENVWLPQLLGRTFSTPEWRFEAGMFLYATALPATWWGQMLLLNKPPVVEVVEEEDAPARNTRQNKRK